MKNYMSKKTQTLSGPRPLKNFTLQINLCAYERPLRLVIVCPQFHFYFTQFYTIGHLFWTEYLKPCRNLSNQQNILQFVKGTIKCNIISSYFGDEIDIEVVHLHNKNKVLMKLVFLSNSVIFAFLSFSLASFCLSLNEMAEKWLSVLVYAL